MTRSAAHYVKFEEERTRPVWDLIARVPVSDARRAADIGCGPGNSTEVLRARYPEAEIVGIDSSPDMVAAARKRLPDIAFDIADIRGWHGAGFDVILANAVIQWIPDHEALLPALIGKLAPGGSLAVQTPDNLDEPTHRLMRAVAADGPWAKTLADAAGARAAPQPRLVLPVPSSPCVARRHLAHDVFSPTRRRARHRRVGQGHGPQALPRSARSGGARGLSYALRGGDRQGLSGGGRRHGAAALPAAVLRRNTLIMGPAI